VDLHSKEDGPPHRALATFAVKDNKTVFGFNQTHTKKVFYINDMFRSIERRQAIFTKLRIMYMQSKFHFLKRFILQTVYTVCATINYRIVSVTNWNKYLHYGKSGTE
jgi:hypothetical protein